MIWTFLIGFTIGVASIILSWLPQVTLADFPVIGQSVSDVLTMGVGYWNTFLGIFPYAVVPWRLFLYGVIPLEVGILILKLLFGSHVPAQSVN